MLGDIEIGDILIFQCPHLDGIIMGLVSVLDEESNSYPWIKVWFIDFDNDPSQMSVYHSTSDPFNLEQDVWPISLVKSAFDPTAEDFRQIRGNASVAFALIWPYLKATDAPNTHHARPQFRPA